MVGARLPEHILAAHALEAGQDVLQRVVEGVADMQPPGDIGRRNDDGEGFCFGRLPGTERADSSHWRVDAPFHILRD